MADERSREDLEEELRIVEEDIASLRPVLGDLRRQVGQREDAPTDVEERSLQIQQLEEQEAILGRIEERRAELRRRLGLE
ncbi:MAG: hypothetical protein ACJ72W_07435 [Actinoallomurus sp.]